MPLILAGLALLIGVPAQSSAADACAGNLCRYREENRILLHSAERTRVVMMGDSITEGWIAADPSIFRDGVVDRGISGETTTQMLARFRQDVIDLKPRAVHIMGGTNDIFGHADPTTVDNIVSNVRSMGELARAHGIRVIIASDLPAMRDGHAVTIIADLNRRLAAMARHQGFDFVDYFGALGNAGGGIDAVDAADGVHPTVAGYARMRPLAAKAIASVR